MDKTTLSGTTTLNPTNQPLVRMSVIVAISVAKQAQGKGIASQMCIDSQSKARALGCRAMQYNLVVATNLKAIRLWKKHGFEIVGTLPKAFLHSIFGYVDAYVMYKDLNS